MHASEVPALIDLRRWAIEQALALAGRGSAVEDVIYAATCIEDHVLGNAPALADDDAEDAP